MKNINMIKKDLLEIQKSFNPEKSTYKVFDELIKHNYSPEEMLNVLSKIRGIHKYPDFLKAQFVDVINNLTILKEQEKRKQEAEKREEERQKQQANTQELKDIIDSLEKSNKSNKPTKKPEKESDDKKSYLAPTKKSMEFLEEIGDKAVLKTKKIAKVGKDKTADMIEGDSGSLVYIILILLVIISIVGIGLFILLY